MRIILAILLTIVSISAMADCDLKEIDANNKFDAAMTLLDIIGVVDSNEAEIKNAIKQLSKENTKISLLIAFKQENIDFICSIKQLNKFNGTIKNNIKNSFITYDEFLQKKILWNLELLDSFNTDNISNLNTFDNKIADLAIKRKSLFKIYAKATGNLLLITQFEKVDDEKAHIEGVDGKYWNRLWITDNERKLLLKKIASMAKSDNFDSLLGLAIAVEAQLSYKNKGVETMETIKNKYENN